MILACDLDWLFSWKDWFYCIIGSVIGFVVGVVWSRHESRKAFEAGIQPAREHLIYALNKATEHIKTARELFAIASPPNYNLDVAILLRAVDRAAPFLAEETLQRVDAVRFQIDHASNKMAMIYHVAATDGIRKGMEHPEIASLATHFDLIDTMIADAIFKVRNDTSKPLPPILPF